MRLTVTDLQTSAQVSSRQYTEDGFLRVAVRGARVGIQKYLASELGLKDRNPQDVVNVLRPPEEVFSADSLQSYKDADFTIEHPDDMVNPDTYNSVSVGHITSEGRRSGDWVEFDSIIKSKEGIKSIESGLSGVSMGYSMDIDSSKGVWAPTGEDYEFVQRSIIINHCAATANPRAGASAKILDNKPKVQQMKITLTDGNTISVDSEEKAMLIQSAFDSQQKRLVDAESKLKDMEEEKDKAEAAKDMAAEENEKMKDELEEEKKKTSDSNLSALVSNVAKTMDSAKKIAGKDFACDSMNEIAIKRAALSDAYPKKDWKNLSDAVITFAFDEAEEKKADDEDEYEKEKAADSWSRLANDAQSVSVKDAQSARDENYRKFCKGEKI